MGKKSGKNAGDTESRLRSPRATQLGGARFRGFGNAVALAAVVYLSASGCATTEEAAPKAPEKTHYTLSTGQTTVHPGLLPRETPVFVEWHYSNGDKKSQQGFTGWDFDGDGRFEMVEVLNDEASVQATIFDFDGDGQIDSKRAK